MYNAFVPFAVPSPSDALLPPPYPRYVIRIEEMATRVSAGETRSSRFALVNALPRPSRAERNRADTEVGIPSAVV